MLLSIKQCFVLMILMIKNVDPFSINKCCSMNEQLGDDMVCTESNTTFTYNNVKDINYGVSPCNIQAVIFDNEFTIANDGLLKVDYKTEEYPPESYCLENINDVTYAFICECVGKRLCFNKCCFTNEHLIIEKEEDSNKPLISCGSNEDEDEDFDYKLLLNDTITNYSVMYQIPKCDGKLQAFLDSEIDENGFAYANEGDAVYPKDYCSDYGSNSTKRILACLSPPPLKLITYFSIFFGTLGILMLGLTSYIYFFVPGFPWLFSRIMGLHCVCMMITNIILIIISLSGFALRTTMCSISGFTMQFTFLSTFFWLNVMCIDMSWLFTGLKSHANLLHDERKRFWKYSIYAWGVPFFITSIAIIVEYTSVSNGSVFKPNMGEIRCWFKDKGSIWIYCYGPVAVILLKNLGLFIYTSIRIMTLKRDSKVLKEPENHRHGIKKDKKRFMLYIKLFILMGVTWVTEILSSLFGDKDSIKYVWYVTYIINLLRSVFIFVIFCCKRKVWMNILVKHPSLKNCEKLFGRCLWKDHNIDENTQTDTESSNIRSSVEMQNTKF